jgi:dihydroneopterin aldolase
MTDHIRLRRIGVFAYHGVHEEEQRLGQRFYVSLDCGLDLAAAGVADDLAESIDYGTLAERVQEMAVTTTYKTIEALAEAIAAACLMEFSRLETITVTVEKPGAAIAAILEGVSVEITRSRKEAPAHG